MKISFLIVNVYGIGGTIRSTLNLAGALAEHHDVEIVSLVRTSASPALAVSPKVRVRSLVEGREDAEGFDPAHDPVNAPSADYPTADSMAKYTSALLDQRVAAYLRGSDADVIIGTRPGVNVYLARYGPRRALLVGQEHLTRGMHDRSVCAAQDAAISRLDALVTVSEADARAYREALPAHARTLVRRIPNGCPRPATAPSTGEHKVIVAAGRLIPVKNYGLLIDAFSKVASVHPDWSLRLYGRGRQERTLRRRVTELGLSERVTLMGAHSPMEPEWAKGSIAAVTSKAESFGLSIVEAMHAGLPVVSTDCPYGPGEIISDGLDGLLVEPGDADAMAEGLLRLIADSGRRSAMARAARTKALDFAPVRIAQCYEQLFTELRAERGRTAPAPGARSPRRTRARTVRTLGSLRPVRALRRTVRRGAAAILRTGRRDGAQEIPTARGARGLPPRAHCTVTEDGGLALALPVDGLPGGGRQEGTLVFRLRSRRDGERTRAGEGSSEIRVPLPPDDEAVEGRLHVRVERAAHRLAEGRWDSYVEHLPDGVRRRVHAELVEQAPLVGSAPRVAPDGVSAWIPYTTSDGYLAVRTWHRTAHAEVRGVQVGAYGTRVEATLFGADLADAGADAGAGARPVVEATVRGSSHTRSLRVPVERSTAGDGDEHHGHEHGHGQRFSFTVPHGDLADRFSGEREVWDLRLLTGRSGEQPVRIGRIGGDIVDRKATDKYPIVRPRAAAGLRIRPYFTTANNLSLLVRLAGQPGAGLSSPRSARAVT